jgi:hypothetical protein
MLDRRSFATLAVSLALVACSGSKPAASHTLVTAVDQTVAKRQTIGNCWLYAEASWLESLTKTASGQETNVSESYWTWWHWYDQIIGGSASELNTGGDWEKAKAIILRHGFLLEGEFIPDEASAEASSRQLEAETQINDALGSGSLAELSDRTPEKVRLALDDAFGTHMAAAEALARRADTAVVGKDGTTLAVALDQWQEVGFPRLYGKDTAASPEVEAGRAKVLRRVLRALNDHAPVVMSVMIDFGALDKTNATFEKAYLERNGSDRQGGHMVVLEDYAVENAPGYGAVGFGDVPVAEKAAALDGALTLLKAKNSWGASRLDRGITDGTTAFDRAYLFSQLPWRADGENLNDPSVTYYTTLGSFVIPPGY